MRKAEIMKKNIMIALVLIAIISCKKPTATENEKNTSMAEPETQEEPKTTEVKVKKKKMGINENTLVGITYSSKNQIYFLKGFKEVGGMILSASTSRKKYSMSFFEKPGAKLALLEECYVGTNPRYTIIDRVMIRINGNIAWQYDPTKKLCALISDKKISENKFGAKRAWKVQTVKGMMKITEINSSRVYYLTENGTNNLIFQ